MEFTLDHGCRLVLRVRTLPLTQMVSATQLMVISRPYITYNLQLCAAVRPRTVPYGHRTAYQLHYWPHGAVPKH